MFRTAEKRPAGSFHIFNASAEHFKVPSTLGEKYRRNLGKKRFFLKSGTHDLETPMCIFYMHVRITTRIDIYSYCVLQCGMSDFKLPPFGLRIPPKPFFWSLEGGPKNGGNTPFSPPNFLDPKPEVWVDIWAPKM